MTAEDAVSESITTDEPIVIEAWISDSPRRQGTDDSALPDFGAPLVNAAESFNRAHPRYQVQIHRVNPIALPEEVAAATARGNPPDLAEYFHMSTQTALDTRAGNGDPLFVPVQRAIAGRTEILGERVVVADLLPSVRNFYSLGGELLSMPTGVSTHIMFGNKAILDRAQIERMPATWQELTDACAAVAKLPDGPARGVCWPIFGWLFQMEIAGQGGLFCNNGNGRSGRATRIFLDSAEVLNYVRWWKRMYEDGYYHYTGEPRDYFGAMEAFARQEIAFVVTSSAVSRQLADLAAAAGIELVGGQLPRYDARSSPGGPVGGLSFFLTAGLPQEKQDGALAFLQYQLSAQLAVARMYDRTLPVTLPAYQQAMAEDWVEPYPGFRVVTEQVVSADSTPAAAGPLIGNLYAINKVLTYAMEDVLVRDAEPASRFRAATEQAQGLLERHNAAALAYPPVTPDMLRAG
jgi:sn-glycerol 3-phosphate transport system substrate-binding protein